MIRYFLLSMLIFTCGQTDGRKEDSPKKEVEKINFLKKFKKINSITLETLTNDSLYSTLVDRDEVYLYFGGDSSIIYQHGFFEFHAGVYAVSKDSSLNIFIKRTIGHDNIFSGILYVRVDSKSEKKLIFPLTGNSDTVYQKINQVIDEKTFIIERVQFEKSIHRLKDQEKVKCKVTIEKIFAEKDFIHTDLIEEKKLECCTDNLLDEGKYSCE